MELYDKQTLSDHTGDAVARRDLRAAMAFVAENPEAFGLVADAYPIATARLLIAASGQVTHGGLPELSHADGVASARAVFDGLSLPTDELQGVLEATFGDRHSHREQLVSRYTAALSEALAWSILKGPAEGASFEQTCVMLGSQLRHGLRLWRDTLSERDPASVNERCFDVSVGACRITDVGEGEYDLDIFAGGDYRVFLLDGAGMAPLWTNDSSVICPDGSSDPDGRTLRLKHPEPFAILLLSGSVCDQNAADHRAARNAPGLIWRHRMRLEEHFLRLLTACLRESEFGDRAAHLFTGRLSGRDGGSGAVAVQCDGAFEVFRAVCQARLTVLEKLLALLPEGYDPEAAVEPPSREETETAYLCRLLDRNAGLEERVTDALRQCILRQLNGHADGEIAVPDAPGYRRLDLDELVRVFRRYDADNDEDRARIEENCRVLREGLSDYWITLRPRFLTVTKDMAHPAKREENKRGYETCMELNRELSALLRKRKDTIDRVRTLLSNGLTVLESEQNDWVCGRAGDDSLNAWVASLQLDLPAALAELGEDWKRDTDRYRALHAAYTSEREKMFRRDISEPYGFFAGDWEAILEGSMTSERWDELKSGVEMGAQASAYGELLDALRRISDATGILRNRISDRVADVRAARELSDRRDLRLACLRASAYEDVAWGEETVAVMSPAMRNEYRLMLRRYKEALELHRHRVAVFEEYERMYTTYIR